MFTSLSDTQGMVIVCPVVALRASGIEDIIENKVNGFNSKNDLGNWTEKIILLMEDEVLRRDFGNQALKYSKEYSSEAIAEKVLDAY